MKEYKKIIAFYYGLCYNSNIVIDVEIVNTRTSEK
jgi:hypothetical protein